MKLNASTNPPGPSTEHLVCCGGRGPFRMCRNCASLAGCAATALGDVLGSLRLTLMRVIRVGEPNFGNTSEHREGWCIGPVHGTCHRGIARTNPSTHACTPRTHARPRARTPTRNQATTRTRARAQSQTHTQSANRISSTKSKTQSETSLRDWAKNRPDERTGRALAGQLGISDLSSYPWPLLCVVRHSSLLATLPRHMENEPRAYLVRS